MTEKGTGEGVIVDIGVVVVNQSNGKLTRCACGAPKIVLSFTLDSSWDDLEPVAGQWCASCSISDPESVAVGELVGPDERNS